MSIRLAVSGFVAGVIFGMSGFNFPAAALPSFAFIFLIYGALILWELRVLLPPMSRITPYGPALPPATREAVQIHLPRSAQTRSSTA